MSNRFFWECSPIYRCRTSDSGPSMILSNKIKSKKMRHLRLSKSNQMLLTKTISIPRLLGKQLQISYWVCPWLDDLVSADKHSQNPDHMPLTLMMIKNMRRINNAGTLTVRNSLVLCPGEERKFPSSPSHCKNY
jgi:hypothetical protein